MLCVQIMDIGAIREDVWRDAAEDRARDEGVAKAVAAVQAGLEAVLREEAGEAARDAADLPWVWLERAVLLGGLLVSGWLAKGGLQRLWQRCCGPSAAEPVLPGQHQAEAPSAPAPTVYSVGSSLPPYHLAAAKPERPVGPEDPIYWA
jgi:hypothetical protein